MSKRQSKLMNRYKVDCMLKIGWGVEEYSTHVFAYDMHEAEMIAKMRVARERGNRAEVLVEDIVLEDEDGS